MDTPKSLDDSFKSEYLLSTFKTEELTLTNISNNFICKIDSPSRDMPDFFGGNFHLSALLALRAVFGSLEPKYKQDYSLKRIKLKCNLPVLSRDFEIGFDFNSHKCELDYFVKELDSVDKHFSGKLSLSQEMSFLNLDNSFFEYNQGGFKEDNFDISYKLEGDSVYGHVAPIKTNAFFLHPLLVQRIVSQCCDIHACTFFGKPKRDLATALCSLDMEYSSDNLSNITDLTCNVECKRKSYVNNKSIFLYDYLVCNQGERLVSGTLIGAN